MNEKLNELNSLYALSQRRELSDEETAKMQRLYDELSAVASVGMQASPRDGQYFYIED